MTAPERPRGQEPGLGEVQALERRLEARAASADAARARVESACERAGLIVRKARERAEQRANRRSEQALAEAGREADEARRTAQKQGEELRLSLQREREGTLVALLTLVLPETSPEAER